MRFIAVLMLLWAVAPAQAGAQAPKTVCTITVNSPDEKETLAARLPKGEYRFVEPARLYVLSYDGPGLRRLHGRR